MQKRVCVSVCVFMCMYVCVRVGVSVYPVDVSVCECTWVCERVSECVRACVSSWNEVTAQFLISCKLEHKRVLHIFSSFYLLSAFIRTCSVLKKVELNAQHGDDTSSAHQERSNSVSLYHTLTLLLSLGIAPRFYCLNLYFCFIIM